MLTQEDGRWGLGLQIPEIPGDELGDTTLGQLRQAWVELVVGVTRKGSISALDLRPGVGSACVDVSPGLQTFRTNPGGSWPRSIDLQRWKLESRGLEAKGVLFRLRGGRWTRLRANSGVQYGETLLILADERCAIPSSVIAGQLDRILSDGLTWQILELHFPNGIVPAVEDWVIRLGHEMINRAWKLELLSLPRCYSERGQPVFWVGDCPVAKLQAPEPGDVAIASLHIGSNIHSINVEAGSSASTGVSIGVRTACSARLVIIGIRDLTLDLHFIPSPTSASRISDAANCAQRLRIQIGSQVFEAWKSTSNKIPAPMGEMPEPLVTLGDNSNRASVTLWERGKQRTVRGLNSRGVAKVIGDSLLSVERVEVEAGNLGRLVMDLERISADYSSGEGDFDRLAWWSHIVSLSPPTEPSRTHTVLKRPHRVLSLVVQPVERVALIRSRLSLRRRVRVRGA
jgi:hypothetical protein